MSKILFIMFQGSGTNLKSWNEYTESKFLDQLKLTIIIYINNLSTIWTCIFIPF